LPQQNTSLSQATTFEPNLVNPWGLTFGPSTPAWLANEGTSTLSIISGTGSISPLRVAVGTDTPTGIVSNPFTSDFLIPASSTGGGGGSFQALFITATEQGNIWAWSPNLTTPTSAVRVGGSPSSVFKGLALAANGTERFLYAADFANGRIVVFDTQFRVVNLTGRFVDPNLPSGYSPFNVANILGDIFVAYAQQNQSSPGDEVAGSGLGYVSVFDANGRFVRRFASRDVLNAPWGMVLAPVSFGDVGGCLLVGNFGNGRVWAFDLATGQQRGQVRTSNNREIVIEGLWGLAFGNGVLGQLTNTLFFNAGINDETDGIFGRIEPASNTSSTSASG
jgi:uncharacterized protein (TIGR03118 family)